MSEVLVQR